MKRLALFLMFALTFLLVGSPAFAQNASGGSVQTPTTTEQLYSTVAQMTPEQRQRLLENADDIRQGRSAAAATNEWLDVGARLGQGLAATARELGVAVNDFAKSPVGMVAITLLVWHFMGDTIVHLGMAGAMFFLGYPTWYFIFRRILGEFTNEGKFVRFDMNMHGQDGAYFWFYTVPLGLFIGIIVLVLTI